MTKLFQVGVLGLSKIYDMPGTWTDDDYRSLLQQLEIDDIDEIAPADLLDFMDLLYKDGVGIINSALFHGGFLTGGQQFDYVTVDPDSEQGLILFGWRDAFHDLCSQHEISPEDACIHFGYSHPAIASIALNTSKPEKMIKNAGILSRDIPGVFWDAMKSEGIIDPNFPYL